MLLELPPVPAGAGPPSWFVEDGWDKGGGDEDVSLEPLLLTGGAGSPPWFAEDD